MLWNRERGQSAAEFVVVVPFLFLIFFLIVDFGWLFKNWIVVTSAARETTRCAAVARCYVDDAETTPQEFACEQIRGGIGSNVLDNTLVTVEYFDLPDTPAGIEGGQGDYVVVSIASQNEFISPVVPFLSVITGGASGLSDSIELNARNVMRLEQTPEGASGAASCAP
ncbi:MAG TPA: TadE family protein [Dehalococcoidia bacterium]|nr:TadE family protein [Dehalococcoidia bacterium]